MSWRAFSKGRVDEEAAAREENRSKAPGPTERSVTVHGTPVERRTNREVKLANDDGHTIDGSLRSDLNLRSDAWPLTPTLFGHGQTSALLIVT
jgi:hypothetical protein